ncbi:hypothetical protein [Pseudonocardia alaniniphila]|uniref:DUF3558 domain-containing protein n=1 Tax=Pseudonocardia alaniniphila TaxID=75291 RepID=A0ABS9TI94_9PSEU|nr:hypothetical protein [Pseudonocardia alaniniphila]MCH6168271.1 hypothetical protein [Pseudonocardia alaniniphila]
MADERRSLWAVLTHTLPVLAAAALLAGCTGTSTPAPPDALPPAPPPASPAACVLDTARFAATTGLTWTPDATTASDTRCVYDPSGAAAAGSAGDGPAFVAVDVAPAGAADPSDTLDSVAGLCEDNSRADVTAGGGGFVCRFQGGSVFGATLRGDRLVTLAASAVPLGTTAARLVTAFGEQLGALR